MRAGGSGNGHCEHVPYSPSRQRPEKCVPVQKSGKCPPALGLRSKNWNRIEKLAPGLGRICENAVSEASNGDGVDHDKSRRSEASKCWREATIRSMQARGAQQAWRGGDPLGLRRACEQTEHASVEHAQQRREVGTPWEGPAFRAKRRT